MNCDEARDISRMPCMHLVDGVLARDKLMNLMVELLLCVPRSIKQADTI